MVIPWGTKRGATTEILLRLILFDILTVMVNTRTLTSDQIVQNLIHTCLPTYTQRSMRKCKTGGLHQCQYPAFVVILQFCTMLPLGILSKVCKSSLCIVACESTIILVKFSFKKQNSIILAVGLYRFLNQIGKNQMRESILREKNHKRNTNVFSKSWASRD